MGNYVSSTDPVYLGTSQYGPGSTNRDSGYGQVWGVPVEGKPGVYGIHNLGNDTYTVLEAGSVTLTVRGGTGQNDASTTVIRMNIDPRYPELCSPDVYWSVSGAQTATTGDIAFQLDPGSICAVKQTKRPAYGTPASNDLNGNKAPLLQGTVTTNTYAGSAARSGNFGTNTSAPGQFFFASDRTYSRGTLEPIELPMKLVASGFTCSIASENNGISTFPSVSVGATDVAGPPLTITTTCDGKNSSGVAIPVGIKFTASGGAFTTGGGKQMHHDSQKSFYLTLSKTGNPSCDVNTNGLVTLDGSDTNNVATVTTGQTLKTATYPLQITPALCTTGNLSQPPGPYEMQVTANLTSY
ncbi:hypothetical protein A6U95_06605 [Serratia sp. 14-2641]|nr:hypothetical protein A6U95_06605 [Serratia sp. 14-2641]